MKMSIGEKKFRRSRAGVVAALIATAFLQQIQACGPAFPDTGPGGNPVDPSVSPGRDRGYFDLSGENAQPPPQKNVPGSWIVAFRANAARESLHFANFAMESRFHQTTLSRSFASDPRVRSVDFITALDLSSPEIGSELSGLLTGNGVFGVLPPPSSVAAVAKVDFASDDEARSVLGEWEAAGKTWFAEANGISDLYGTLDAADETFKTWAAAYDKTVVPHLAVTKVAAALARFTNPDPEKDLDKPGNQDILDSPPIIAVIDNGVDYAHPQLKNQIFENPSPGSSGCSDDVHGCNVTAMKGGSLGNGAVLPDGVSGEGQPCDGEDRKCPHGTHVAGIIAAEPDVSAGTVGAPAGVCPFCKILPVKATSAGGGITDASQLAGLKYVSLFRGRYGNAIRVVNASFGQFTRNRAIAVMVATLRRAGNGIVVVSAAGNEDTMLRAYPAALQDAVAVAALDSNNSKASSSNFGSWVDISAPGVEIESTAPGGGSVPKSGTSMAAPVVAGVMGLMVAYKPGISAADLIGRITSTADPGIYRGDDESNLNYRFYYARIGGEVVPRPLLGAGLVQAQGTLQNVPTGAFTSARIQRVTPGCGIVFDPQGKPRNSWDLGLLALLLVAPFYAASRHARRALRAQRRVKEAPWG
ncbi:MAG: hypothetical protein RIQ81_512 [Pseudomonadota bacterium]|jgi:subtilisin family serine protease